MCWSSYETSSAKGEYINICNIGNDQHFDYTIMSNSNLEMVKRLMSNPKWEKFAASVSEERPADVKDGKSKEDLLKELC